MILFCCKGVFAQQVNNIEIDSSGNKILLGRTTIKAFSDVNFPWFQKNYDNYILNNEVINRLKPIMNNYTIQVFYGTWCGDSKRELPKFYKVMKAAGLDDESIEMIAVHKKPELYKRSPSGEEKGLNIHRVPTFIVYENDKEIGRIVETPKEDFERDFLNIVNGEKYTPNYLVVEHLNKLFKDSSLKELDTNKLKLVNSYAEFAKGSRELNTYGYKLLRSDEPEKALFAFQLNALMYPYKPNVYDSLGEAYYTLKDYEKSLENYNKVLKLKPDDKNVLEMINRIKEEIKNN